MQTVTQRTEEPTAYNTHFVTHFNLSSQDTPHAPEKSTTLVHIFSERTFFNGWYSSYSTKSEIIIHNYDLRIIWSFEEHMSQSITAGGAMEMWYIAIE